MRWNQVRLQPLLDRPFSIAPRTVHQPEKPLTCDLPIFPDDTHLLYDLNFVPLAGHQHLRPAPCASAHLADQLSHPLPPRPPSTPLSLPICRSANHIRFIQRSLLGHRKYGQHERRGGTPSELEGDEQVQDVRHSPSLSLSRSSASKSERASNQERDKVDSHFPPPPSSPLFSLTLDTDITAECRCTAIRSSRKCWAQSSCSAACWPAAPAPPHLRPQPALAPTPASILRSPPLRRHRGNNRQRWSRASATAGRSRISARLPCIACILDSSAVRRIKPSVGTRVRKTGHNSVSLPSVGDMGSKEHYNLPKFVTSLANRAVKTFGVCTCPFPSLTRSQPTLSY